MVVADGDISLSLCVNKLLATALPPGPPHMNILSVQLPEPTFFMYSILDYLLKFSTTNRKLPSIILTAKHEHTVVLHTMPNVLLQRVQSSVLLGHTYTHT